MGKIYRAEGTRNKELFSIDFHCILSDRENKNWIREYIYNRFIREKLSFQVFKLLGEK